jgi:hypothetical protein
MVSWNKVSVEVSFINQFPPLLNFPGGNGLFCEPGLFGAVGLQVVLVHVFPDFFAGVSHGGAHQ